VITINRVSDHAVEKYQKYMKEIYEKDIVNPNDARSKIIKLFHKATSEFSPGLVIRIIDNDFVDAEYFRYHEWRFVVCNSTIVTIERNIFKKPKKINFKKANRNCRKNKHLKDLKAKRR